MRPPLRVVPPAFNQLAANEDALHVGHFTQETVELARLAATLGLPVDSEPGGVRVAGSRRELDVLARTLAAEVHPAAKLLRRYLEPVRTWKLRTQSLPVDAPIVMGIVNLTEDSFSGDGVGADVRGACERAKVLRAEGATIIDVGAESARADRPIMEEQEEARVVREAVKALIDEGHLVSVDTYKAQVAHAALEAGAEIVNDISGLTEGTGAAAAALEAGAGYVLNYSYSAPKRRPDRPPEYEDVVEETVAWMFERIERLHELGFAGERLAIDPGIAFGKSHDEDIQMLRRIGELHTPGLPVLLAHSRKNFIGSVNASAPDDRDLETHVVTALAYAQGVRLFRVHDVRGTVRAARMAGAIVDAAPGAFGPDATSWPWSANAGSQHATGTEPEGSPPPGQRW